MNPYKDRNQRHSRNSPKEQRSKEIKSEGSIDLTPCTFVHFKLFVSKVRRRRLPKPHQRRFTSFDAFCNFASNVAWIGHASVIASERRCNFQINCTSTELITCDIQDTRKVALQTSLLTVTPSGREKSVSVSKCRYNHIIFDT